MILERFCNIFSIIKQTSHKASGAEEKELPRKIFLWGILRGSCRWAAESPCPVAAPPWAAGHRGMVLGFSWMDCPRPVFSGDFPSRCPNTGNTDGNGRNGCEFLKINCKSSCLHLVFVKNERNHADSHENLKNFS